MTAKVSFTIIMQWITVVMMRIFIHHPRVFKQTLHGDSSSSHHAPCIANAAKPNSSFKLMLEFHLPVQILTASLVPRLLTRCLPEFVHMLYDVNDCFPSADIPRYTYCTLTCSKLVNVFLLRHSRSCGNGLFSIPDIKSWKPRRRLYDPAFKKR